VKEQSTEPAECSRNSGLQAVLLEGLLVAVAGLRFGLTANHVSPRGLALTRNYFPGSNQSASSPTPATNGPANPASAVELLTARLKTKGLQLIESNQVIQLFRDPRYDQELVVFVDARDAQHYRAGHIPGAYQFDHYRADDYLATVLPVCQTAERIVIYCTGGNCEDSEFAAVTLSNAGVSKERLFIYAGGMTEWSANGLPVEAGARKSGNLLNTKSG
jgi:rhodanese-related sulfurtransferase